MPDAVAQAYAERVGTLWRVATPASPVELPFEQAADDELAAFERQTEPRLGPDGDLHGLAAWGTKHAGEVARLAGLLHIAGAADPSEPGPVTAGAVAAAIRLADEYLIPHARRAFGAMHADPAEALATRVVR